MQFEVPCVDSNRPLVGREWLYHELYEILIRQGTADACGLRGAVIHGCVGTGKTAVLYQLANLAPNHASPPVNPTGRLALSGHQPGSGYPSPAAGRRFSQTPRSSSRQSQKSPHGLLTSLHSEENGGHTVGDHSQLAQRQTTTDTTVVSTDSGCFVNSTSRNSINPPGIQIAHSSAGSQVGGSKRHNFFSRSKQCSGSSSGVGGSQPQQHYLHQVQENVATGPDLHTTSVEINHSTTDNDEYCHFVAAHVVAYHFCQVDVASTCCLSRFLTSLVAMLATSPLLTPYGEYLSRNQHLLDYLTEAKALQDPLALYRQVIIEPLRALRKCNRLPAPRLQSGPGAGGANYCNYPSSSSNSSVNTLTMTYLILVDGLDEAEFHRPESTHSIGSFLLSHASELPSWVKVVLSVKTAGGLDLVRGLPLHKVSLDNIVMDERLHRSVEDYVSTRISGSAGAQQHIVGGPENKPAATELMDQFVQYVTGMCKGNFLYLKLLLNLIERGHLNCAPPGPDQHDPTAMDPTRPHPNTGGGLESLPISLSEIFLHLFTLKFPTTEAFERVAAILNICLASLHPLTAQEIYEAVNAGFVEHFLTWEEFCER